MSRLNSKCYRQAEENREKEREGAIMIQRNFRMYLMLTQYKTIQRAVRNIKRIWKGHKIRMTFLKLMKQEKQRMQMMFFNTMASVVQKM